MSRQGTVIRTLLELPAADYIVTLIGNGIMVQGMPFGRESIVAFGPDAHLYGGWNDELDIAVIDLEGKRDRSITREHAPVPVTDEDIEAVLAETSDEQMRSSILDADLPQTKPAFTALVVDDQGQLWLQHSVATGDSLSTWSVLNADGTAFGRVKLPTSAALVAIRAGRAYGTLKDAESGAQYVVVYDVSTP